MTRRRRERRVRLRPAGLAALLCIGFAAAGCDRAAPPKGRALLIGIDGATLRVAKPLMEEGRLPNLARIASEGISGPLRSSPPYLSPRVWNTIATGKAPEKHGIEGWVRAAGSQQGQLYRSTDRKVSALWNIASRAGLTVGVVNWLNTYPPERVRGVLISDYAIPGELAGKQFMKSLFGGGAEGATEEERVAAEGAPTFPAEWRERISQILSTGKPPVEHPDPFRNHADFPPWTQPVLGTLTRARDSDMEVARLALAVESDVHPDLQMVLLQGIDRVSHVLWACLEPPEAYPENIPVPTPAQRAAGAAALREYYEYTDALIGALVAGAAPADLVLVVSDHGFEIGTPFFGLTGAHASTGAQDGVVFARGRDVPRGGAAGSMSVNDVTPTVLAWLGLPVAADMDGHPAAWLQTKARGTIPTYDTDAIQRGDGTAPEVEQKLLEQLRSLGYVQ